MNNNDGHLAHASTAASDVLAERKRQIEAKGWAPEHDDHHKKGELAAVAANYAVAAVICAKLGAAAFAADTDPPLDRTGNAVDWPWDRADWKPGEPRRMLVKAAALILAEIERIDRAGEKGAEAMRPE